MWKFCLLVGFCLVIRPFCASAQQPVQLNDQELLALRVGPSFDAQELDYFGLYAKNQEKVDSLRYGLMAGSFYLEPFSKGRSERILLSQATQAEFVKYVAFYEKVVLDPSQLSPSFLVSLALRTPLRKYEKNGRTIMATSFSGHSYFGEVMRVEGSKILLYDLDLGYDAQLARTDVRLLNLDTLQEIKIFRQHIAKTTGLITGLLVGIGATAGGFSPYNFSNGNVQIAANLLSFPAAGLLVGLVLDEVFAFKTTYRTYYDSRVQFSGPPNKEKEEQFLIKKEKLIQLAQHEREKAIKIMKNRMMFRGQMPPELLRKLLQ